jgi:hypothetical protein
MLLILEIVLTVSAWRNGWKALALLPLGVCFAIGLTVGVVSPQSVSAFSPVLIGGDLVAVAILIGLCSKKPAGAAPRQPAPTALTNA